MPPTAVDEQVRGNLARVQATIAEACQRRGRDPADVRLVAVTKYASLDSIRALIDAGVHELGENRVQQLSKRAATFGTANTGLFDPLGASATAPRWHMIGHLQRNKVRACLGHTRILHSLDSRRLASEIEKQAARLDLIVDAFIELNLAGEASKSGAPAAEAPALAEAVRGWPHIRLHGLMTMPPYDPDPEAARPYFIRLRELLEHLQQRDVVGPDCVHLSMGMTIDYTVAVEEGATFVRIGSALFEGVGPD
jgi:hypothetical protein